MMNASRGLRISCLAIAAGLLATSCGAEVQDPATQVSPSAEEPEIQSLREADLGNMTWIDPLAPPESSGEIKLVGSKAKDGYSTYELGKIVYADLNGDGVEDAVAPFKSVSGNAYWEHYVPWIATEDGPVQVPDEIGYSHNCGSTVQSVVPAKHGVTITEYQRSEFRDSACAQNGPLKQVRTVSVEQYAGDDEYYLVRQDSHGGYGGYCHLEQQGDTVAVQIPIYAAPNAKSEIPLAPHTMFGYLSGPQESAKLSQDGQWFLSGVLLQDEKAAGGLASMCAWLPTVDNPSYEDGESIFDEHGKLAG